MWQYLDETEQQRVLRRLDELGGTCTATRRLVHAQAEPGRRAPGAQREFLLRLRTWPGGEERLVGTLQAHGPPVTWEA
jgi:hypothetical protein